MKSLITTLTMIFISFGANAFTVENLYQNCKPYQNNGFEFDNLSNDQSNKALICIGYIRGVIDMGHKNCQYLRESYNIKSIDIMAFNSLSQFTANGLNPSINGTIASFNNFAENNVDKWKYRPTVFSAQFVGKNYPCKLEE